MLPRIDAPSNPADYSRRGFLQAAAATWAAASAGALATPLLGADPRSVSATPPAPAFRISIAEWSLHRSIRSGKLTNLDFPVVAKQEFGVDAVEYVNSFFKDKAGDKAYLNDLKDRCAGEGVRSLLIMCDGEGQLGAKDETNRTRAVENHHKWVEAAKLLGCHSIRVNASSSGTFEEQQRLAADGLSRLGEFADGYGINVLVENHGGLSSSGVWLAGVMKLVGRANVGTLPDFGNFRISKVGSITNWYDRYQGVEELMPFAKAVSAKSHEFDAEGTEVRTDYFRMMKIVLEAGYSGYVGIEWEGGSPGEYEGVRLTKKLLERVRDGVA